jgi:hypothetical protein
MLERNGEGWPPVILSGWGLYCFSWGLPLGCAYPPSQDPGGLSGKGASVLLANFGYPIGLFIQSGANKAVAEAQSAGVRNFINEIKRKMADMVNMDIMPLMGGGDGVTIFEFASQPIESPTVLRRLMLEEYVAGLISKEYYVQQANIYDIGKTFYEAPTGPERKPSYREAES